MVLEAVRDVAAQLKLDVRGNVSVNLGARHGARLGEPVAKMIGALEERQEEVELVRRGLAIRGRDHSLTPAQHARPLTAPTLNLLKRQTDAHTPHSSLIAVPSTSLRRTCLPRA